MAKIPALMAKKTSVWRRPAGVASAINRNGNVKKWLRKQTPDSEVADEMALYLSSFLSYHCLHLYTMQTTLSLLPVISAKLWEVPVVAIRRQKNREENNWKIIPVCKAAKSKPGHANTVKAAMA